MVWDLIFSLLILLLHVGLVAMIFYALLCITDLEVDHMNPFEATAAVNAWILPEFVLQGVVCVLCLLTRHWFLFLFVLPLTCYHLMKFWKREHLIDVTEVFRNLNYEKKCRLFKLGVYLISFSILMFRTISGAISVFRSESLDYRSSFLVF